VIRLCNRGGRWAPEELHMAHEGAHANASESDSGVGDRLSASGRARGIDTIHEWLSFFFK